MIAKNSIAMCRDGHMAATGLYHLHTKCQSFECKKEIDMVRRFWYTRISDMVRALCAQSNSFIEIYDG